MSKDMHTCKGGDNCHEENHLCKVVVRKEFDRVRVIVKDAVFYCKNCGRAACREDNLCRPARI